MVTSMKVGWSFQLPSGVLEAAVDRQPELDDGGAAAGEARLAVARQVAHQDDFVEARHGVVLPPESSWAIVQRSATSLAGARSICMRGAIR
jgi:hypothetical protein